MEKEIQQLLDENKNNCITCLKFKVTGETRARCIDEASDKHNLCVSVLSTARRIISSILKGSDFSRVNCKHYKDGE